MTSSDPATLDALTARLHQLETAAAQRSQQTRYLAVSAALGAATVVALGLPFLWDDSSRFKEPIAVAGWRLVGYDKLYAFGQPIALFPRILPILIVIAALATATAVLARPELAVGAAVLDGLVIVGCVFGSQFVHKIGVKLIADQSQEISGPGSGWFVAGVLLAGWAGLALWVWGRDRLPAELEAAEDTTTPEVAP